MWVSNFFNFLEHQNIFKLHCDTYAVDNKNVPLYFFCLYLRHYWPIFTIFSLAHSADNLQ